MQNIKKTPHTFVTQPFLPPLEEFVPYLEQIWRDKWITNRGQFHEKFEAALANYFGHPHLSLFNNGTIALITALQALGITSEVITTPYSFVATTHSLLWNGIKPVFVDIDPDTFNLDPDRIEAAITPRTTAILPVHVYGTPCDTGRINSIADSHGLKVIYDAAHAFGVRHQGQSLLGRGDLTILSFHATKVFTTFEGGAIACPDAKTKKQIDYLKNFGFENEQTVLAMGINGKMNEFQAALGLLQLNYIDQCIARRKEIDARYRERLGNLPGIRILALRQDTKHNFAYFPILVGPEFPLTRDELHLKLNDQGINTRKYFYPLISNFPMYRDLPSASAENLPVASRIAEQVLCLPIYPDLQTAAQEQVIEIIRGVL